MAEALSNSHAIEPFGYVSLTPHHSARLRDFGTLDTLERNFDAVDEVLIADPEFPQDEAVELVDRCHQHGVRVRVAPSTMEILMDRIEFVPGQTPAAVRAQAARLRGPRLRGQAQLRHRRARRCSCSSSRRSWR